MELKRTFEKGVMNKDYDERLVPNGFYRHAENIVTDSTDGSDVGVIKNILSNKQLTNINLGSNPITLNGFADETKQKIYYFIKSDSGTFLIEYDDKSQSVSLVLHDTRLNKVLDINENSRITAVQKIYNDNDDKDLLLWTNNDMEICCINIERAKGFGENGFDKKDIYLIKEPPIHAPTVNFLQTELGSNEIEEKFVLFAYRYKYIDGEYSALSPFSNYNFIPKSFEVDFETLHNKAMVNNFNAVDIKFATGDHRVVSIQVIAKFSNSENLYVVETLEKQKEGLIDNGSFNITYDNKKLYAVLPAKELYRSFDNVPRKAKALTLIGNRIVLGNYTEGYDIKDADGKKIKLAYDVDIVSKDVNQEKKYNGTIKEVYPYQSSFQIKKNSSFIDYSNGGFITDKPINGGIFDGNATIDPSGLTIPIYNNNLGAAQIEFLQGSSLEFNIVLLNEDEEVVYQKLYTTYLNNAFDSFDIESSVEIMQFIQQINSDIKNNFVDESLPNDAVITQYPSITVDSSLNHIYFNLHPLIYDLTLSSIVVTYQFDQRTSFKQKYTGLPTSLKSFTDYEIGIVYQDDYKRSSTVLTSLNNTKFIPFTNAFTQNKLKISVRNSAPYWAKYYRFAIKTKPLEYENVYVNRFYEENGFTWAKLEGDNKDKIKKNDMLLVKKTANNNITKPIKIKVLDIVDQPSDFIKGNKDVNGVDIIEEPGLYMKIKPVEFSMNMNDYEVKQAKEVARKSGTGNYPLAYVDLFSTIENSVTKLFPLTTGSVIQLYIKSSNNPDAGWQDNILNKTYYVTENFTSIGDWFIQNITSINSLYGNEGNAEDNYYGNIEVVRGELYVDPITAIVLFTPDPNGKEYLKVTGTKPGMTNNRFGYLDINLNVRTSDGFYVFETQPKKEVDLGIYYLSSETFEIENGLHKGNSANQTSSTPAVCTLDFFNCYAFGNGIESYKIRDGFNENSLNIDYTPCTTIDDEFKETVRTSDITWGNVYNESSNINGLNEFNTANLNWKELDKQNGEIRFILAREGNLLVIQEDKWGQVLYGKHAIYSADGNATITTTDDVLRDYIPYAGTYGITDIESFVKVANRCYAVDKKRGAVLRLSNDGINKITNGLDHWFKTNFQDRNRANVIAGFDPFYGTYNITIDEQPEAITQLKDRQKLIKYNLDNSLKLYYKLNGITNDIVVNYNVTYGSINIKATSYSVFNFYDLTGQGSIVIPNELVHPDLYLEITPVSNAASFELTTILPQGNPLTVEHIVLSSLYDTGKLFSKGYSINNDVIYRSDLVLQPNGITERLIENGSQGVGKFPNNNDVVNVHVFNNMMQGVDSQVANEYKVMYMIRSGEFDFLDIDNALLSANEISLVTNTKGKSGSFVFNRTNNNEKLFIIYDLRSSIARDISTTATITNNPQLVYFNNLFTTDHPVQSALITKQPTNGSVIISALNSFSVLYEGSNTTDTMYMEYELVIQGKIYKKSLTINVNL